MAQPRRTKKGELKNAGGRLFNEPGNFVGEARGALAPFKQKGFGPVFIGFNRF